MAAGAVTTDQVPVDLLRTEMIRGFERYNEQDRNFRSIFCTQTTGSTVRVYQRTKAFRRMADTTIPDLARLDYQTISLKAPIRYGLKAGVTQAALDEGITAADVREEHTEALQADQRLITQSVLYPMLNDGGWWDGTAAPPPYKSNAFVAGHTHYLGYNVGGVPTLTIINRMRHHMAEHGWTGNVVGWMHNNNVENIENIAEWATAPGPMRTRQMEQLQELGFGPSFIAGGVPIVAEDWVPENYLLLTSLGHGGKLCRWRNHEGEARDGRLQMWTNDENVAYSLDQDYVRYGFCNTVALRSGGVAAKLDAGAWADPAATVWDL